MAKSAQRLLTIVCKYLLRNFVRQHKISCFQFLLNTGLKVMENSESLYFGVIEKVTRYIIWVKDMNSIQNWLDYNLTWNMLFSDMSEQLLIFWKLISFSKKYSQFFVALLIVFLRGMKKKLGSIFCHSTWNFKS